MADKIPVCTKKSEKCDKFIRKSEKSAVAFHSNPIILRTEKSMKKRNFSPFFFIIIPIIAVLIIFIIAETRLEKVMLPLAESAVNAEVEKAVSEAINTVSEKGIDYDTLIHTNYSPDGKITALTLNTGNANKVQTMITGAIVENLEKSEGIYLSVPIGSLIGTNLFSGKGIKVKISMYPVSTVSGSIKSDFSDCGINQILHRVYVETVFSIVVIMPTKKVEKNIVQNVVLSEKIIFGEVPNLYYGR